MQDIKSKLWETKSQLRNSKPHYQMSQLGDEAIIMRNEVAITLNKFTIKSGC